ncbi:MAG: hypothetical protein RDU20_13955 [Desulfomonilaceae bacterium]|nr:hypothetical protein [Desulfomonilaceae bacterium]
MKDKDTRAAIVQLILQLRGDEPEVEWNEDQPQFGCGKEHLQELRAIEKECRDAVSLFQAHLPEKPNPTIRPVIQLLVRDGFVLINQSGSVGGNHGPLGRDPANVPMHLSIPFLP